MKTWKTGKVDGKEGVFLRDVDREIFELPESAFGADVELNDDGHAVEVTLPEKRFMPFADAGARVEAKRLYTVKAEKTDGTIVQIPLEPQINNNVAAPDMFIGLQHYTRKGYNVLFDLETGIGAFCPTWGCWAKWNKDTEGYCSERHAEITKPSAVEGSFGSGATTSRNWG